MSHASANLSAEVSERLDRALATRQHLPLLAALDGHLPGLAAAVGAYTRWHRPLCCSRLSYQLPHTQSQLHRPFAVAGSACRRYVPWQRSHWCSRRICSTTSTWCVARSRISHGLTLSVSNAQLVHDHLPLLANIDQRRLLNVGMLVISLIVTTILILRVFISLADRSSHRTACAACEARDRELARLESCDVNLDLSL